MGMLGKKQEEFSRALVLLLMYMHSEGFQTRLGDTYPGKFEHAPGGKHPLGLAIDINLFRDGVYLTKTEDHEKFGKFWVALGGIWGGDWEDGNHYEWPF
jgi:hypothetical protein